MNALNIPPPLVENPDLSQRKINFLTRIRYALFGNPLNPFDNSIFHKLSLLPFLAWVGLGADGLSSSSYGPEEAFKALGDYPELAIFVALATAITILIISASYSQIIELFPSGGGGYLVASKLLSPKLGMFSGSALVIDYILTISLSIASCGDALFSFLPLNWQPLKFPFVLLALILLSILNLRGIKESIKILLPIFITFLITHIVAISGALIIRMPDIAEVTLRTSENINQAFTKLGIIPALLLIMRAYSMGAGTYTGIEAVSNGLPILSEPKVRTGKQTMAYMAISLSLTAFGLMIAYLLHEVHPIAGKTLNAVLFEKLTLGWGITGEILVIITLISEGALLFVAAQAGFIDGPRVLSNMAIDSWIPSQFAHLSDRLVTQNGVMTMAIASFIVLALSGGEVEFLVVLYSINVFITFTLSQLGMVIHWLKERQGGRNWMRPLLISGAGCALSIFILGFVTLEKFTEGGWLTLLITGGFSGFALLVQRHYQGVKKLLNRLDSLLDVATLSDSADLSNSEKLDPDARTAVLLVNGWNGLGLHSLFSILFLYGDFYTNFVILHVGLLDAGSFKGANEVEVLRAQTQLETDKYVNYLRTNGRAAEGRCAVHADVVDAIEELALATARDYPKAVFFGGQFVFSNENPWTRFLHNNFVFSIQRRLYLRGLHFMVLPVRID